MTTESYPDLKPGDAVIIDGAWGSWKGRLGLVIAIVKTTPSSRCLVVWSDVCSVRWEPEDVLLKVETT